LSRSLLLVPLPLFLFFFLLSSFFSLRNESEKSLGKEKKDGFREHKFEKREEEERRREKREERSERDSEVSLLSAGNKEEEEERRREVEERGEKKIGKKIFDVRRELIVI